MNDIDSQLYRDTFQRLQEAEGNEDYYRARGQLFGRLDAGARILATLSAASTVASLLADSPGLLKVLAGLTLIVTTCNTVLGLGELARTRRDLAARWTAVAGRLHALDLRVRRGEGSPEELLAIVADAEQLENQDTEPRNDRASVRAQTNVMRRYANRYAPSVAMPSSS